MPIRHALRLAIVSCCIALAGCAPFRTADNSLDAASRQLAKQNIDLDAAAASAPKAQITPQGGLIIAGKPAALTPEQRAEVLRYRQEYVAIARQGIAIGRDGVAAGRRAVAPMVFAALSGESDAEINARVQKRMAGVYAATARLCNRLPHLMASQQQLAIGVPAFRPYATLTQKKIDDCRKDALQQGDSDQ